MQGFEYPPEPHTRRHGPSGYQDYESYRDWVRDEFFFRCVYCLHREQWYGRGATFHIEHFLPVTSDPRAELEYANLLYACATCNNAKSELIGVPDPCRIAFADCLSVNENGEVQPLNDAGRSLVEKLRLNNRANLLYRSRWMRTLAALRLNDPALYREWMSFPQNLPDLRNKRPPANSHPDSVHDCWFALRERGNLPATY